MPGWFCKFWKKSGGGGVLFASENTVVEFNSAMERIGMLVLKVKVLQHAILKAQAGFEVGGFASNAIFICLVSSESLKGFLR
jgi:hypothetical protein